MKQESPPPPNAPQVSLEDKYTQSDGWAFMSGVQALVRLPLMQRQRDLAAGLNTGGFISGYRGSPLGGYDQALWAAKKHLAAHNVVFQPGVNEELAATAIWGTQQLDLFPEQRKVDGVFGIWYGKGPGVDRCSDVFKHANMAGTSRHGGVIAVAGDDHVAKSSTAAHQSDHIFKACGFPVFFPSDVQGILDMGLHAFAMSRFAGLWCGMKTIQEVVESSATVRVDQDRINLLIPQDFPMPVSGVHIRWPDAPLDQEARLMETKWYAALAYVRANRLNRNVIEGPDDRFGIIASGKAFNDTRQALADLGLTDDICRRLGIRLHQVNVVWPLEATITREFATGLREILVVEEKRQMIEYQLKEELYNWRQDVRPDVVGKFDETNDDHSGGEWARPNPAENWLLRAKADLTPALIAKAIARRLRRLGVPPDVDARMQQRLSVIEAKEHTLELSRGQKAQDRPPWFCSGCPHNTSTRVPEGSRALAGIGCHYMAIWMDRSTSTFTQMGGEGVPWVGQSYFTNEQHVFANLGDGTWFHSGILAIRQCIAAGVNITFKILYNDAVAMTGGQQVGERPEGLSVPQIVKSCVAEGAARVLLVSDQPEKYNGMVLEPGVTIHHRDELDRLQRECREIRGTSIIVYDQTCATEKRRRRKRGLMEDPSRSVVINELVCEGCGDCSAQSNCLSVEPLETEFGRKRQINLSTCNKDESCLKGFCPSFVTVEGARPRKPQIGGAPNASAQGQISVTEPPMPVLPDCRQPYRMVIAGVGGTGVITIGQLLGVAAHIEGKAVVTQDAAGLAQKGGSTWSHVQIADQAGVIHTSKVDMATADLVLACDGIVAAGQSTLSLMVEGHTQVVMNSHDTPTAAFIASPDWEFPGQACQSAIMQAVGAERLSLIDAQRLATGLLGDAIFANPLLLGFAWQKGLIPLSQESIFSAMQLNAVSVEKNQQAFIWGRRAAVDPALGESDSAQPISFVKRKSLDERIDERVEFLTTYQNRTYAESYRKFVERVRQAEHAVSDKTPLTEAVMRGLFKLMAYKDEYEVARLHTDSAFARKIAERFEPGYRIAHYLAPPLFSRRNENGELVKRRFGPWVRSLMGLLVLLRFLRGTAFDPFGHTEERRTERALIQEYRQCIMVLLEGLSEQRLGLAAQIAAIPDKIRGFGHVKARHLSQARAEWQDLMRQWHQL
ncbi:MAG: indolepyruvate ferredoxin oxidoreductase family protein [Burkholderiaceae bacterium]|nr:indolepyruvate ferredoxin oxidoreductase family protein [Burkholderiaceae bacterium]